MGFKGDYLCAGCMAKKVVPAILLFIPDLHCLVNVDTVSEFSTH